MRDGRFGWLDIVQLAAILLVAIALVPAGAHLFELPNKMGLPPDQYMTVQNIYRGWALFGIPIIAALVVLPIHTMLVRRNRRAMTLSLVAFLCIVATQVIFWNFTFPMNELTRNWTVAPPDLEAARWQWEIAHAVNAGMTFMALVTLTLSILESRSPVRETVLRTSAKTSIRA